MFSFEKLDIWQKARRLASEVYRTIESFPRSEQFALSQQLRRAAVSIAANIAEGSSRSSDKEFSRYIEIAYGSLCEVIAELSIARDMGYVGEDGFRRLYGEYLSLAKMLSKFRASLETAWVKTRSAGDKQAIKLSDPRTIKPKNEDLDAR